MPESRSRSSGGFTLFEVLVTATVTAIVLIGVLATNLQLATSGVRISNYAEMEAQVRRALERLGHDVRIASNLHWNSASDITFTLPTSSGTTTQVTYAWNSTTGDFYTVPGADSSVTAGRTILVQGIPAVSNGSVGLAFTRYDRLGTAATTDLDTKRIQINLTVARSARLLAGTTERGVSASFTLRNKPVE